MVLIVGEGNISDCPAAIAVLVVFVKALYGYVFDFE